MLCMKSNYRRWLVGASVLCVMLVRFDALAAENSPSLASHSMQLASSETVADPGLAALAEGVFDQRSPSDYWEAATGDVLAAIREKAARPFSKVAPLVGLGVGAVLGTALTQLYYPGVAESWGFAKTALISTLGTGSIGAIAASMSEFGRRAVLKGILEVAEGRMKVNPAHMMVVRSSFRMGLPLATSILGLFAQNEVLPYLLNQTTQEPNGENLGFVVGGAMVLSAADAGWRWLRRNGQLEKLDQALQGAEGAYRRTEVAHTEDTRARSYVQNRKDVFANAFRDGFVRGSGLDGKHTAPSKADTRSTQEQFRELGHHIGASFRLARQAPHANADVQRRFNDVFHNTTGLLRSLR